MAMRNRSWTACTVPTRSGKQRRGGTKRSAFDRTWKQAAVQVAQIGCRPSFKSVCPCRSERVSGDERLRTAMPHRAPLSKRTVNGTAPIPGKSRGRGERRGGTPRLCPPRASRCRSQSRTAPALLPPISSTRTPLHTPPSTSPARKHARPHTMCALQSQSKSATRALACSCTQMPADAGTLVRQTGTVRMLATTPRYRSVRFHLYIELYVFNSYGHPCTYARTHTDAHTS